MDSERTYTGSVILQISIMWCFSKKKTIQVKLARLTFVNYHFILLTGEIMTHSKFYWPDLTSKWLTFHNNAQADTSI